VTLGFDGVIATALHSETVPGVLGLRQAGASIGLARVGLEKDYAVFDTRNQC